MTPRELEGAIAVDHEILGGTPCFMGTRVPIETFLDHIEAGCSLEDFLKGYSSVRRDQASTVLAWLVAQGRRSIGLHM